MKLGWNWDECQCKLPANLWNGNGEPRTPYRWFVLSNVMGRTLEALWRSTHPSWRRNKRTAAVWVEVPVSWVISCFIPLHGIAMNCTCASWNFIELFGPFWGRFSFQAELIVSRCFKMFQASVDIVGPSLTMGCPSGRAAKDVRGRDASSSHPKTPWKEHA